MSNNDHEKELRLVLNGVEYDCTATFSQTSGILAHLEVNLDRNLTKEERQGFAKKLPSIERRCEVFKAAGCTILSVESSYEAEAREEAAAEKVPAKKAPRTPKKRTAKTKAKHELLEVRAALKSAGISRAQLIRVLNAVHPAYQSVSDSAIKKIL